MLMVPVGKAVMWVALCCRFLWGRAVNVGFGVCVCWSDGFP